MGTRAPHSELPGLSARGHNEGKAPSPLRIRRGQKERRRVVFRDLCDELGYVPDGHDVALPPEGCPSASDAG